MQDTTNDRSFQLRAVSIACCVFLTIILVLRFWSRAISSPSPSSFSRHNGSRFGWDDWTFLLAILVSFPGCGLCLWAIQLGLGQHADSLPLENVVSVMKALAIASILRNFCIALIKTSALFLYARIFQNTSSRFNHALRITHVLNVAVCLGISLYEIVTASSAEQVWQPPYHDISNSFLSTSIGTWLPGAVVDWIVVLLPVPLFWQLQMKRPRKVLVFCVFVCGYTFLAFEISIIVTEIKTGFDVLYNDPTWANAPIMTLNMAQFPVAAVDVSLPSLLFFFKQARQCGFRALFDPASAARHARLNPACHDPVHKQAKPKLPADRSGETATKDSRF